MDRGLQLGPVDTHVPHGTPEMALGCEFYVSVGNRCIEIYPKGRVLGQVHYHLVDPDTVALMEVMEGHASR